MHSRDTKVLIGLLWFNVMYYSSTFFDLLFSWKFLNFLFSVLVFWKHYYYDYDW